MSSDNELDLEIAGANVRLRANGIDARIQRCGKCHGKGTVTSFFLRIDKECSRCHGSRVVLVIE
jgi:DnaJ-class molecular chaperone